MPHEPLLLRSLWRYAVSSLPILLTESVQDADEIIGSGESVSQEPTTDDGSRPSDTAPAVDVYWLSSL